MEKIKNKENKKARLASPFCRRLANRRGFTLLELLVSVFIFSLVMITAVSIFTRFVTFQKSSRSIQQNMEDARYAMELMAKTLRTSSVLSWTPSSINLYDYSQEKCINYSFSSSKINSTSFATTDTTCASATFPAPISMVSNNINSMNFSVTPSALGTVGKVTIAMTICSKGGCFGSEYDRSSLQTSVSLRDYVESNP